jgi:2-methylcitrate dehydratase PrpD
MNMAVAPTLVDRIGTFAARLTQDAVPPEIAERTRDRVLDALSTAVAGRVADPYQPVAAMLVGEPPGDATLLASGDTTGAAMAAFANGVATHALLYEDLSLPSADHPGAVIVPAALAAADSAPIRSASPSPRPTIEDLLLGVLAGYEVQLFLGAISGDGLIRRGFRTTSVFGAVAAAVAAAKVWRMPADRIAAAASIGANFAGGLTEAWSHGSHEPYMQAGMAAQQGVLAARLAAGGASRAAPIFEGKNGFLRAFADTTIDPAVALADPWRITEVICKPYPCSGGKIGAIDSARSLREGGLDPAKIDRVRVWLPALYHGYPGANRVAPFTSMSQAQASGQFCVAAALLGYPIEAVETFTRDFARDDIARLSHRIELLPQPGTALARVEVQFLGGETLSAEVDRRDRQVPSIASMAAKLKALTSVAWPPGAADAVIGIITGPAERPVGEMSMRLRRTG